MAAETAEVTMAALAGVERVEYSRIARLCYGPIAARRPAGGAAGRYLVGLGPAVTAAQSEAVVSRVAMSRVVVVSRVVMSRVALVEGTVV